MSPVDQELAGENETVSFRPAPSSISMRSVTGAENVEFSLWEMLRGNRLCYS